LSTGLDNSSQEYPDLAELVKAWPKLPEDTKNGNHGSHSSTQNRKEVKPSYRSMGRKKGAGKGAPGHAEAQGLIVEFAGAKPL